MSPISKSSASRKLHRWRRVCLILLGAFTLLFVLAYFVLTSSAFITAVLLPKLGKSLHADLSVKSVRLHGLSSVELHHVDLRLPGGAPILQIQQINARFDLARILMGDLVFGDVLVFSPTLTLVQNLDGSLNIDPLFVPAKSARRPPKPSNPHLLDIRNVTLVNAAVEIILNEAGGVRQTIHLTRLNANLDQLLANQSSKLALSLDARFEETDAKARTSLLAQTAITANLATSLDPQLRPKSLRGSVRCDLQDSTEIPANFLGTTLLLETDLTPVAVTRLDLRVSKKDAPLARLNASGPFDLLRQRGRLVVDVTGVDRRLLGLAGAMKDLDFNAANLSLHNEIEIDQAATVIKAAGTLRVEKLSVTSGKPKLTTPVLDLTFGYRLKADPASQSARIEELVCDGTQNRVPFLITKLSQPMTVSWGAGISAPESASLSVILTNFNLADWQPLGGTVVRKGKLTAALHLASSQGEKNLATDLTAHLRDLTVQIGSNQIARSECRVQLCGRVENLTHAIIDPCRLDFSLAGSPALSISGSGAFNLISREASALTRIECDLAAALGAVSYPGATLSQGKANLDLKIATAGKSREINANLAITNLTGQISGLKFDQAALAGETLAQFQSKSITVKKLAVSLDQAGRKSASLALVGDYVFASHSGRANVSLDASLPSILETFPSLPLSANAGELKFTGQITSTDSSVRAAGSIGLNHFSGKIADATFKQASLALETSAVFKNRVLTLEELSGSIAQENQPGGKLNLAGFYAFKDGSGKLTAALDDLNQETLGPFFAAAFTNKSLVSVMISEKGTVEFEPSGAFSVQSIFAVTNFIVQDLKTGKNDAPLWTQLQVDATLRDHQLDLRNFRLALAPGPQAANILNFQGRLDLTASNAVSGELAVVADALDATPFYDLWMENTTNGLSKPKLPPPGQTPGGDREPDPISLPVNHLKLSARVEKLFVHDLAVTNLELSALAQDGKIGVNSLRLWLQGAPLEASGSLDLSVPGYKYDLALRGDKLPLEPVMDLIAPEDRGQYRGVIIADARLEGAGLTGADFKHNLMGTVFLSFTNADIRVIGPKLKLILLPVSLVLRIPEILRSPLHSMSCQALFAQGQVDVKEAIVEGDAFSGRASGVIPLAKNVGDSPLRNLPVEFLLSRPLAKRADLLSNRTPAGDPYVKLPNFIKIKGTLANPKTDISEFAVARILVDSTTGILTQPAGALFRGVEHLLNGKPPAPPAAPPSTNAPPSNPPANP